MKGVHRRVSWVAIAGGVAVVAGLLGPWTRFSGLVYGSQSVSGLDWGRPWLVIPATVAAAGLVVLAERRRWRAWVLLVAAGCGLVVLWDAIDHFRTVAGSQAVPGTSVDLLRPGFGLYLSGAGALVLSVAALLALLANARRAGA